MGAANPAVPSNMTGSGVFARTLAVRPRQFADRIAMAVVALCAALAVAVLAAILLDVVLNGLVALYTLFVARPAQQSALAGGLAAAIVGSLVMLAIGALIGVPLGIGTAIYLSEYGRGTFARTVRFVIDMTAGLPSIVIGVFVWAWLVRQLVGHSNGLAGGIALAIVMIPIVARTVEETLHAVPDTIREASLGLGIRRWKTILRVVLPTAWAGIVTGVVLSVARAAGETAPLLLTAFGAQALNLDVRQPMAALPLQMYTYARAPQTDVQQQAWSAALILILLIGGLSALSRWSVARRIGG
jgi:phosphate transport system permease protein